MFAVRSSQAGSLHVGLALAVRQVPLQSIHVQLSLAGDLRHWNDSHTLLDQQLIKLNKDAPNLTSNTTKAQSSN